jgi:DnaK suppressor protein
MKRAAFLQKIRHVLLKRRDALRRSIDSELALLGRNWALRPVGDSGDDAQDGSDDEMVSRVAQTESRELQAIEAALARMHEGQYGVCVDCRESIPLRVGSILGKGMPQRVVCPQGDLQE